jgi:hypothetical protein
VEREIMDTLLTGNANAISDESIGKIFGDNTVIIADPSVTPRKEGHIRWIPISPLDDKFTRLFLTYGFERVIFLSRYTEPGFTPTDEIYRLNAILALTKQIKLRQFIFIAPYLSEEEENSEKGIILNSIIKLLEYYRDTYNFTLKIIYCPGIVGHLHKGGFFTNLFTDLRKGRPVTLERPAGSRLMFISHEDFSTFMFRLLDDWRDVNESIHLLPSGYETTDDLISVVKSLIPDADISSAQGHPDTILDPEERIARERYGWLALNKTADMVPDLYKEFLEKEHQKLGFFERIRSKVKLPQKLLMIAELAIGTLIVELAVTISRSNVQFRLIDYRLLFIVIMSTIWGSTAGFFSATLMIMSLANAYYRNGTEWVMLFYDPGNWVPFILFYITAAICGYTRQRKEDEAGFVRDENKKLETENEFVSDLYQEALQYKNEYKQNLTLSKQGFGRIFDVVTKLNQSRSELIFAESIPVIEDILDNHSVAIYTIYDSAARFARLEVASASLSKRIKKSLDLSEYTDIIDTLLKGELWINKEPQEGQPCYVAGVLSDDHVTVLIAIYNVAFSQMSVYYANLIRVLAGLLENFIVKAWQYQSAVRQREFYNGGGIMYEDYFRMQLKIQRDMSDNEITDFRLFKLDGLGKSANEWEELLRGKTRYNDSVCLGNDGNIYILATQVDEKGEEIILGRFEKAGLKCEKIEDMYPIDGTKEIESKKEESKKEESKKEESREG